MERLRTEVDAWVTTRNAASTTIHWSFTVEAARDRLARHYEALSSTK